MISDATQLAALRIAIELAYGRTALMTLRQRELFEQQIKAIEARIIAAEARRTTRDGKDDR